MGELKTFETLDCYINARALRRSVSQFCKTLPKEEEYRLKDQIVRASRSITANIAEGYLNNNEYDMMRVIVSDAWRILNGYIAYLKKCAADGVT